MSKGLLLSAMSGGVDSSVATALALEAGYDVVGATLHLKGNEEAEVLAKSCCGSDDKCEITVSMTELSDVLRISRASLYRVMDSLEKSGKINRDGKKIYLQTKSVERK